ATRLEVDGSGEALLLRFGKHSRRQRQACPGMVVRANRRNEAAVVLVTQDCRERRGPRVVRLLRRIGRGEDVSLVVVDEVVDYAGCLRLLLALYVEGGGDLTLLALDRWFSEGHGRLADRRRIEQQARLLEYAAGVEETGRCHGQHLDQPLLLGSAVDRKSVV